LQVVQLHDLVAGVDYAKGAGDAGAVAVAVFGVFCYSAKGPSTFWQATGIGDAQAYAVGWLDVKKGYSVAPALVQARQIDPLEKQGFIFANTAFGIQRH
jgi:hypothetical protein